MAHGFSIWLTGLPASGKTTIGGALADWLGAHRILVETLDGGEIRRGLSADPGLSTEDRQNHDQLVIFGSQLLIPNGIASARTVDFPVP